MTYIHHYSITRSIFTVLKFLSSLVASREAIWKGFLGGSEGKEYTCSAGDLGLILVSGTSPGEANGNPLQYPSLGNPMDRRAWWATVRGVVRVRHDLATKQ